MKRLLLAIAATAPCLLPTSAIAATSGTLDASGSVVYSCDITFPATATLTASNATTLGATSTAAITQNGDTTYTLSALTITEPATASTSGSISVGDDKGGTLVSNTSTANTATGDKLGLVSYNATVTFQLQEGVASALPVGSYTIAATLSCAQKI